MKEDAVEELEQERGMKPERSEFTAEITGRAGRARRGFFARTRRFIGGLVRHAFRGALGYVVQQWAPKAGDRQEGGEKKD